MLTRIEIDGFKNLLNFSLDFGPFTCIAGPTGLGKSNIFDAIHFLSLLATNTLNDAALQIRGDTGEHGDVRDIFHAGKSSRRKQLRIATEMLLSPSDVLDDFGRRVRPSSTFLRYEICIGYEEGDEPGHLVLLHESLDHIQGFETTSHLKFPHKRIFRESVVSRKPRKTSYISTTASQKSEIEIQVHQDGRARGLTQRSPARTAPRTIVGASNNAATPTILAAKREMQSWQVLALEPSAMRNPDRVQTVRDFQVASNGAHLPATLQFMRLVSAMGGESDRTYAETVSRISRLVPISDIRVDEDKLRQVLTLQVRENSGPWLSASSLSDGTLRFLALSVLAQDSRSRLLCIEEPENGIHPAKIEEVVSILADIATDTDLPIGPDNSLRQVVIATHSPVIVQQVHTRNSGDLLFAIETLVRGKNGEPMRTLRCLPLNGTWRSQIESSPSVGVNMMMDYLTLPPGARVSLQDFVNQ